jgi:hypothetical protein
MTRPADMSPSAIEARLVEVSALSPLEFHPLPRVDMSPSAVEARIQEWAELTTLCLELAATSNPSR